MMSATRLILLILPEPMGCLMQELLILQNWRLCGQHMSVDQNCYPLPPRWGSVLGQFVHGRGFGLIEPEGVSLSMHSSLWS